jgi:hypothetical protein
MERLSRLVKENIGIIILLAIVAGAYAFLRTPHSGLTDDEFSAVMTAGKPVLVELFSNT